MHQPAPQPALHAAWQGLLADAAARRGGPPLFPRDAAARLGVSEGELLASACGGRGGVRLAGAPGELLARIAGRELTVIVRNEAAICERTCAWTHRGGPALDGQDAALELDPAGLGLALAYEQDAGAPGFRRSLQFFDLAGRAACKCFGLDREVLAALRAGHAHADQGPAQAVVRDWRPAPPPARDPAPGPGIDAVLAAAAADGAPRRIGVGNGVARLSVVHRVRRLMPMHGYLNILDPGLDVHLRPDLCVRAWAGADPGLTTFGIGHDAIAIGAEARP